MALLLSLSAPLSQNSPTQTREDTELESRREEGGGERESKMWKGRRGGMAGGKETRGGRGGGALRMGN